MIKTALEVRILELVIGHPDIIFPLRTTLPSINYKTKSLIINCQTSPSLLIKNKNAKTVLSLRIIHNLVLKKHTKSNTKMYCKTIQ